MKNASCIILILILTLGVKFSSCSDETSTNPELTIEEKLQKTLDNGIKKYDGKGVSFAVIIPGEFNWQGASGISHQDVSITTDMLFSAGSITKTFTALTILQLTEEGVLSLDDSLHQWLPDYPYVDNTITIRQLLQHTSGIFNLTEHPTIWQDFFSNPDKTWDPDDLLRTYLMPADFPQGTNWTYSNTGYILLRMIIEKATNSTITSAYRTRLINPLGLVDSYLVPYETLPTEPVHGWFN